MKRISLIFLGLLLSACSAAPVATPTATPPTLPSTTPTQTETPTLTVTSTETLVPTSTLRPPETVSFYQLRLQYFSTSDWAKLIILNPDAILSTRLVASEGNITRAYVSFDEDKHLVIDLDQSLQDAMAGKQVSLTLDMALPAENPPSSFSITSEHGGIAGSSFSINLFSGDTVEPIKKFNHQWRDQNNPDTSAWRATVDLASLASVSPSEKQVQRPNHMIWAVYYGGYGNKTGSGEWPWENMVVDRPLKLYSSMDRDTVALQIRQAKSAGIDGFFVSASDLRDPWYGGQFALLLDEAAKQGFRIAMLLEAADNPHNCMQPEDWIYDWLAYAISTYGHHPAYMQLNGKPLVVIYSSGGYPAQTWQVLFNRLKGANLDASYLAMGYDLSNLGTFDGLFDYAIFDYPDLTTLYSSMASSTRNYSLLSPDVSAKIFTATVQPGFNNSYWTDSPSVIDRQNGDYYRHTFDAAVNSGADWIMVTSWNEFTEATNIEPSQLYDDQYLQITREYADRWKNTP